jgi:hypothetical protein
VNVSLDALIIPKYGALGASLANGLAQTIGVAGLFYKADGVYAMRSQIRYLGALCVSGAVMVGAVLVVVRALPAWLGLFAGIVTGAIVFFVSLRTTRSLEAEDWDRLRHWTKLMPKPIHRIMLRLPALQRGPDSTPESAVAASSSSQ